MWDKTALLLLCTTLCLHQQTAATPLRDLRAQSGNVLARWAALDDRLLAPRSVLDGATDGATGQIPADVTSDSPALPTSRLEEPPVITSPQQAPSSPPQEAPSSPPHETPSSSPPEPASSVVPSPDEPIVTPKPSIVVPDIIPSNIVPSNIIPTPSVPAPNITPTPTPTPTPSIAIPSDIIPGPAQSVHSSIKSEFIDPIIPTPPNIIPSVALPSDLIPGPVGSLVNSFLSKVTPVIPPIITPSDNPIGSIISNLIPSTPVIVLPTGIPNIPSFIESAIPDIIPTTPILNLPTGIPNVPSIIESAIPDLFPTTPIIVLPSGIPNIPSFVESVIPDIIPTTPILNLPTGIPNIPSVIESAIPDLFPTTPIIVLPSDIPIIPSFIESALSNLLPTTPIFPLPSGLPHIPSAVNSFFSEVLPTTPIFVLPTGVPDLPSFVESAIGSFISEVTNGPLPLPTLTASPTPLPMNPGQSTGDSSITNLPVTTVVPTAISSSRVLQDDNNGTSVITPSSAGTTQLVTGTSPTTGDSASILTPTGSGNSAAISTKSPTAPSNETSNDSGASRTIAKSTGALPTDTAPTSASDDVGANGYPSGISTRTPPDFTFAPVPESTTVDGASQVIPSPTLVITTTSTPDSNWIDPSNGGAMNPPATTGSGGSPGINPIGGGGTGDSNDGPQDGSEGSPGPVDLPPPAIAGIAAGAGTAALLAIFAAGFLVRRAYARRDLARRASTGVYPQEAWLYDPMVSKTYGSTSFSAGSHPSLAYTPSPDHEMSGALGGLSHASGPAMMLDERGMAEMDENSINELDSQTATTPYGLHAARLPPLRESAESDSDLPDDDDPASINEARPLMLIAGHPVFPRSVTRSPTPTPAPAPTWNDIDMEHALAHDDDARTAAYNGYGYGNPSALYHGYTSLQPSRSPPQSVSRPYRTPPTPASWTIRSTGPASASASAYQPVPLTSSSRSPPTPMTPSRGLGIAQMERVTSNAWNRSSSSLGTFGRGGGGGGGVYGRVSSNMSERDFANPSHIGRDRI